MVNKLLYIIVLLIVSIGLQAQRVTTGGQKVGGAGGVKIAPSDIPVNTTGWTSVTSGSGNLLWFTDFDSDATDSNVSSSDALTIFGAAEAPGGSTAIYDFGTNDNQIIDEGGGDHYFRMYLDFPCGGGPSCGSSLMKSMDVDYGGPTNLSDLKEIWLSADMRHESGFNQVLSGKSPLGFRTGVWTWTDAGNPPALDMGNNIRHGWTTGEHHKEQIYYYGQQLSFGETFVWSNTYPTGSNLSFNSTWHNYAIHATLDPNAPDSVDAYIEYYYDGVLTTRYDTLSLSMHDSLRFDWMMIGFFPSNGDPTVSDWYVDLDNIALFTFEEGDSTWTGIDWKTYPDSALEVVMPGALDADTTNWGDFVTPEFTIFKHVDFSAANGNTVINDVNTETNGAIIWDAPDFNIDGGTSDQDDSIVIVNISGTIDTLQAIYYAGNNSNYGAQEIFPLNLDGVGTTNDTLTYINYQDSIFILAGEDRTWFSKFGGIAAYDRADITGVNPPGGGFYGPTCPDTSALGIYEPNRGWSSRWGNYYDSTYSYLYHHDLNWNNCATYGGTSGYVMDDGIGQNMLGYGVTKKRTMRIILNTVASAGNGNADGILELYVNDTLVAQKTDVMFRMYEDHYINAIFDAFLSGPGSGRTHGHLYRDDIVLWRESNWAGERTARTLGDVISTPY